MRPFFIPGPVGFAPRPAAAGRKKSPAFAGLVTIPARGRAARATRPPGVYCGQAAELYVGSLVAVLQV